MLNFIDKTKREFGYSCSKLGFKSKHERLNDGINFIKEVSIGEGGYWDSVSFKNSLKNFTGKQISNIHELSERIYFNTPLEDIRTIFNRKDLSTDFKRVLFNFMVNNYYSEQTQEYRILQKSLKKLL